MVNVFTVVGEHQVDAMRLLVLGADGRYYDYLPARQRFLPVEPGRDWLVYAWSTADAVVVSPGNEGSIPGIQGTHPRR